MKSVISTACLILIISGWAHAQGQNVNSSVTPAAKKEKRFSAEWRFRLSGSSYQDETSQSKVVDIRTDIKAKYDLSKNLQLDIQPALRMQSGQTNSMVGAYQPENKISLVQAAAHYEPYLEMKISGGALNQKYMHSSLLVDPIAFPAARIEGNWAVGKLKTSIDAETAIPTSSTLSTNTKELESTPALNSAAAKFIWELEKNLYWKTSLGYFVYSNLPSAVAQASAKLGNDIKKISDKEYEFIYKYEGVEASTEVKFPVLDSLDLALGGEYLLNQKAPADLNAAFRVNLAGEIHMNPNTDIVLGGSYFQVQPEAAVAYFNAAGSDTNRIGHSADVSFVFKKDGFTAGASYVETELMYTNDVQLKEKTLLLRLQTLFVSL
ncbi:hypothetical protein [Bdellovibrio reynosensis]|uniref:Uncharacterized protein n=1 Tax=Bdellovibrio reynosensis TaxID=2835041 RepID=A0ABY4CB95_9BACT|nr:hypothetical protein [Bdellovibrio reynosensis]UOF01709.1 hypothetical protein MNR06_01915 [Bdellovibrio reynosensis]